MTTEQIEALSQVLECVEQKLDRMLEAIERAS